MVAPWAQNQPVQNMHPDNVRDPPPTRYRSAGGGPSYWANGGFRPTQDEINQTRDLIQTLENIISSEERNNVNIDQIIQDYNQSLSSINNVDINQIIRNNPYVSTSNNTQ